MTIVYDCRLPSAGALSSNACNGRSARRSYIAGVDIRVVNRLFLLFARLTHGVRLVFESIRLIFEALVFKHIGPIIHGVGHRIGIIGDGVTGRVVTLAAATGQREERRYRDDLRENASYAFSSNPFGSGCANTWPGFRCRAAHDLWRITPSIDKKTGGLPRR